MIRQVSTELSRAVRFFEVALVICLATFSEATPLPHSPLVDIIEVSDKILSGYNPATSWLIMPPIDMPTICACLTSKASMTPTVSAAISFKL